MLLVFSLMLDGVVAACEAEVVDARALAISMVVAELSESSAVATPVVRSVPPDSVACDTLLMVSLMLDGVLGFVCKADLEGTGVLTLLRVVE